MQFLVARSKRATPSTYLRSRCGGSRAVAGRWHAASTVLLLFALLRTVGEMTGAWADAARRGRCVGRSLDDTYLERVRGYHQTEPIAMELRTRKL